MSSETPRGTLDLAPPRALAWAEIAAGLLLGTASLAADPTGRVLLLPAAALLVAVGLRDTLLRPVLSLRDEDLVVVDGWRRRHVPYADLERARVVTDRRAPLLELDLGDALVVLARRRLGRQPGEVLELLKQRSAADPDRQSGAEG